PRAAQSIKTTAHPAECHVPDASSSPIAPPALQPRPRDLAAVVFALVLPTIVTWLYFFQAEAMPPRVQLTVFSTVKTIQFAFPLFWVLAIQRGRVTLRPPTSQGLEIGVAFGAIVAAATFAL